LKFNNWIRLTIIKLVLVAGNENAPDSQILSVQQFKVSVGIDNLDLFDLLKFIKQSKLGFKVRLSIILHENSKYLLFRVNN